MKREEIERAAREYQENVLGLVDYTVEPPGWDEAFIAGAELVLRRAEELVEAARLGLSFAPKGPVPEGLAPMFYHTLEYKSEVELQKRIDEARKLVEQWREESES